MPATASKVDLLKIDQLKINLDTLGRVLYIGLDRDTQRSAAVTDENCWT